MQSDLVHFTYFVQQVGTPVPGVAVSLVVNEPNGGVQQTNLVTDTSGTATWSFRMNKNKGGCGTYTATADAFVGGQELLSATAFELICN